MQVNLVLKSWKVVQDEKSKLPRIVGLFSVMMGEKEIASQSFNEGYNSKEIPFSGDTINALINVESIIKTELEKMMT